MLNRRN